MKTLNKKNLLLQFMITVTSLNQLLYTFSCLPWVLEAPKIFFLSNTLGGPYTFSEGILSFN